MLHLVTIPFHTDVNILLYGDTNLSSVNKTIFKAVHKRDYKDIPTWALQ